VRNNLKTYIIFLLTAVYCIAIGAVNTHVAYQSVTLTHTNLQENSIAIFSENLYCPTIQADNLLNPSPNLPTTACKNPSNDLSEFAYSYEQIEGAAILQYTSIARNILFHHRKTDIIFPSHYFW
jgi:hypothetical protein